MSPIEMFSRTKNRFWQKWSIAVKIIPFVALVVGAKFLFHYKGWEIMEINAVFTSLVGGTIFLIGFLISGVLSDYKESEKLPSELAASLRTLNDDTDTLIRSFDSQAARDFLVYQKELYYSLIKWFYKQERTTAMLSKISAMNDYISALEKEGIQVNYIVRLKNEQNSLRKMLLRIDTVRDTDFIGPAYTIVEVMGMLIAFGLIIIKMDPFYASLFCTTLVTFLVAYMFLLIHDLDNPFDYSSKGESGTEVSLKPLNDLEHSIYAEI